MVKLNNKTDDSYSKRAIFLPFKQKEFLETVQKKSKLSLQKIADFLGISIRTLTDWKREKFSISFFALNKICEEFDISFPENVEIKKPFWYVSRGALKGGLATFNKYGRIGGNPEKRKKRWREWWEKEGKFKKNIIANIRLSVMIPGKSSKLAEIVGIILGDGGMTKNQVVITLHKKDDRQFAEYVAGLLSDLFKVNPAIYERRREDVVCVVISRIKLVEFLQSCGLKIGNKVRQQVCIPKWIEQSETLSKACLRGLMDTDGCFYIDRHVYKDKIYLNCCLNFTNRSLPILNFFKSKLEMFGFHPTRRTKYGIFLRREDEIIRYFKKIGSSNPKHIKKFKKYFLNKYGEVPKWL